MFCKSSLLCPLLALSPPLSLSAPVMLQIRTPRVTQNGITEFFFFNFIFYIIGKYCKNFKKTKLGCLEGHLKIDSIRYGMCELESDTFEKFRM